MLSQQGRGLATLQEHLLMRSMNSVIDDLALDEPTTWMPQPDFTDCESLRQRASATSVDASLLQSVADVDPFALVKNDVNALSSNIKELLGSDHPVLETVAQYFFNQEAGKKVRPTLVLLMSKALQAHMDIEQGQARPTEEVAAMYAQQVRLAAITEQIHTASLLHDDVIDVADTRRGVKSVNSMFGNKLAILAGDFLLARASICLARLRNVEVVEIISTSIEHLVKGEVMQMKPDLRGNAAFEMYLRKNYYKTGSLMANSILASTVLMGAPKDLQLIAFQYGESCGHAFQLIDDALDFEGSLATLGKPALADLKQGLATAPVLIAQESHPELRPLIERKFSYPEDIDIAASAVHSSQSIVQTRALATAYVEKAISCALQLHPSPARDSLIRMALKIVNRSS